MHALSGVRHDPSLEKVRPADKGRKLPSRTRNLLEIREIKGRPTRKSNIALEGVKGFSKGSVYPRRGRSHDPHGNSTIRRASA